VLRKAGVLLAIAAVTMVLFEPICGALHRCGCRAPWSGGKTYCNVKQAVGPHCPWCEHRALGGVAVALVLGGQLLVFRFALGRAGLAGAAAAALVALPLLSVPAGAIAWLPTDYPHFLVENARGRLGLPAGPFHCYGSGPPHVH
jgi:hypothetical protein